MFYVYILENPQGRFYVGQTKDPRRRLDQHNATLAEGVTYPRRHGPWRLVWQELHETRSSAMRRERQIKGMKSARWVRERLLTPRDDDTGSGC